MKMKAIVKETRAPGVKVAELEVPTPGPGEVLIKVAATAICGTDMHYYHWNKAAEDFGDKYNIQFPMTIGHECSGKVVEVGPMVDNIKLGDRISVETHIPCGKCFHCQNGMSYNCSGNMAIYGTSTNGCFAEYAIVPASVAFVLPEGVSYEEGSLLEPGGVSMRAVEEAKVQPGETVVVNGCGALGLLSILLLKASNAARVIGVDIDDYHLDLAKKLGAIPINSMKCDSIAEIKKLCADRGGADVVLEHSGALAAYKNIFEYIRPEGRLVTVGHPGGAAPINVMADMNTRGVSWKGIFGRRIWETWWNLTSLMSAGRVHLTDAVTHRFTLDQAEEAFQQNIKGAGKILFIVDEDLCKNG